MNANVLEKLKILAESAKYDVSCASSGTVRANKPGTLGNTVPSLASFSMVPVTFVAKQSNGDWGTVNGGQTATSNFITGNPLRALSKKDWSKSKSENT
ncbi:hypothetical protein, partial [Bacteroides fragilis]|uniref:hypothetical protein n=1 Tax=Bacteroides fragilis TaxID=817 RepID=UPI0005CEC40F